jgi:hypothetical protein
MALGVPSGDRPDSSGRQPAEFGLKLSGLEVDIEETSAV